MYGSNKLKHIQADTIHMRNILIILTVLILSATVSATDDFIHPSGISVISRHSVNSVNLTLGDTLVISRTLINNTASPLTTVSFSEAVPPDFSLISVTATVNGISTEIGSFGPYTDSVLNGQHSYHWVADSPVLSENLSLQILPSDSLELTARFVCNGVGSFTLPFHNMIGIINGSALFAEGNPVDIQVRLSSDISEDSDLLIPNSSLLTRAWPNPFNPSVTIDYETSYPSGQINMIIYDVLGRTVYDDSQRIKDGTGYFNWKPKTTQSSGTYFYRLTTGSQSAVGTLLLIK